ncbi:MAG: phosphotransferase [Opitutaceae bacterium]|nr:phosphotransferase [Opitutaceae bacterium]
MSHSPETSSDALILSLRAAQVVVSENIRITPLSGGVSSDIFLVEDGSRRLAVKRALARLKVRDDWFADISRNRIEQAYLEYASRVSPGSVPRILHSHPGEGWFAMEYLGDSFKNWKSLLLSGQADPVHAVHAGETLGRLHGASWGEPSIAARFDTLVNFHALRIEPYLLTTAARVPGARSFLEMEAQRLGGTRLALVHGDYSPKNLLISPERLVVLDAECAWFGDPAFDTAFLLNHLHLKALVDRAHPEPFLALVPAFWRSYAAALGSHATPDLEARTLRLLLGLMLGRVHGKSPAEYLSPADGERITRFVLHHVPNPPRLLSGFTEDWRAALHHP